MPTLVESLRTHYDEQVRVQASARPPTGAIVERIALVAVTHYGTHATVSHAALPTASQDDLAAVVAKVRRSAASRREPVEWQVYAHDPAAAQLAHELTAAGFTPGWQRSVLIAAVDEIATPDVAGPTWTVEPIRYGNPRRQVEASTRRGRGGCPELGRRGRQVQGCRPGTVGR